jgi:hypothetical protein
MHEIGLYLDETMAAGIAAQNQIFNSLSNLLNEHTAGHPEDKPAAAAAVQTVLAMRQPVYTERDRICSDFSQIVADIKKDSPSNAKQAALMTQDTMHDMRALLQKGSQGFGLHITPEELVESILGLLDMAACSESNKPKMDQLRLRLREDLIEYFTLMEASKEQDG